MNMKNKTSSEQVASHMKEQRECYKALLVKLEDQKKAIDRYDESKLLAIIGEKSDLIDVSQKLEKKIASVLKGIPEVQRKKVIQETGVLRGQIEGLLKKLIALEAVCEEGLNNQKQQVYEQIKDLEKKQKLLKKYGDSGKSMSLFSRNV